MGEQAVRGIGNQVSTSRAPDGTVYPLPSEHEARASFAQIARAAHVQKAKGRRIVVSFDRRSHNPILREAQLDKASPPIPWLSNLRVQFAYT